MNLLRIIDRIYKIEAFQTAGPGRMLQLRKVPAVSYLILAAPGTAG